MTNYFRKTHFQSLPNEVLTNILTYVDTLDLLNFCDAFGCDYFCKERSVIRTLNVYRRFAFNDLTRLSQHIVYEYVTTFNVNCVYWINATLLRKFISRLVKLENLYAINTSLDVTTSDLAVYKELNKLKKLAVTVRKHDEIGFHEKVLSVKTLYLNIMSQHTSSAIMNMIFPNVSEMWIDVQLPKLSNVNGRTEYFYTKPSHNKIFYKITFPCPSLDCEFLGLSRYYNVRRMAQPYTACCERFDLNASKADKIEHENSEPWRTLEELHCQPPYGPKDARRLFLNETTLDTIRFEELNFSYSVPICNERHITAAKQILKSPSAQNLRKLSVTLCLLFNDEKEKEKVTFGFKRKRLGLKTSITSTPPEHIFSNIPHLEAFEIYPCARSHPSAAQTLCLISHFRSLRSLVIELPVFLDGFFLIDVLKHCKLLEVLKVSSENSNEKLNFNLSKALPEAHSLKDLRFENRNIQIDKLLKNLCHIKTKKLERITLICHSTDKFSASSLEALLQSNPQLCFLYFIIQQCPETSRKKAQELLNVYKKLHPAKVFYIKARNDFPIPEIHFHEMVEPWSNVATVNACDDFLSF